MAAVCGQAVSKILASAWERLHDPSTVYSVLTSPAGWLVRTEGFCTSVVGNLALRPLAHNIACGGIR
jgi:hypothetical protein